MRMPQLGLLFRTGRHMFPSTIGYMFDKAHAEFYQTSDGITVGTMVDGTALGATITYNSAGSGDVLLAVDGVTFNSRATIRESVSGFTAAASSYPHQDQGGRTFVATVKMTGSENNQQIQVGFNRDHACGTFPPPTNSGREGEIGFTPVAGFWRPTLVRQDGVIVDVCQYASTFGPTTTADVSVFAELKVSMGYRCATATFYINDVLIWHTDKNLPNGNDIEGLLDTALFSSVALRNRVAASPGSTMTVKQCYSWMHPLAGIQFKMSI